MHAIDLEPGRPAADECLPYYFEYIRLVSGGHIVKLLERQVAESAAYLAVLTPGRRSGGRRGGVESGRASGMWPTSAVFAYRGYESRARPVRDKSSSRYRRRQFQSARSARVCRIAGVRAASRRACGADAPTWRARARRIGPYASTRHRNTKAAPSSITWRTSARRRETAEAAGDS